MVLADRRRWFAADDDVPALPLLRDASAARHRIRVGYLSSSAAEPSTRVLDPVGLVDHSGRWYLVAEQDRQMRMFRVSRMTEVDLLAESADLADTRPLPEIWAELRGRLEREQQDLAVVVRVDDAIADRFRRLARMPLVPGTAIEVVERREYAEVWRFRVRQPDTILAMAVMFAPQIEILEPAWMPAEVIAAARRVIESVSE